MALQTTAAGTESVFALESQSPHRVAFNLERVMRTTFIIDDFQQIYSVIDIFDDLLKQCYQDFGPRYDKLAGLNDIMAGALVAGNDAHARHAGIFHPPASRRPRVAHAGCAVTPGASRAPVPLADLAVSPHFWHCLLCHNVRQGGISNAPRAG